MTHISSYSNITTDDFFAEENGCSSEPSLLLFSANDRSSLEGQFKSLQRHLANPAVKVQMGDLAYTLNEKRSRMFYRGFAIAQDVMLQDSTFQVGHVGDSPPKIGFIFTGQGAQWPQMGKTLLESFPAAATVIHQLDYPLKTLDDPPAWSLYSMYSIF